MEQVDLVLVGAGVVGLAVAGELARRCPGRAIVLLERNGKFGQETSSRNSEVIHAGLYYPAGSLKARLCVEGNRLLYAFCVQHGVGYRRSGKLIVARDRGDLPGLEALAEQARRNGVTGLEFFGQNRVAALEPHLRTAGAIWSPTTGVVDSHALMAQLEWQAVQGGVLPAYRHTVTRIETSGTGYRVDLINPDGSRDALWGERIINCAGLAAARIAAGCGIDLDRAGYRTYLGKGEYFSVPPAKARLVSRLVYPPPPADLAGLGIHVTKTLDGRMRLGPNLIYLDRVDYTVEAAHARDFYETVRQILPFLVLNDLEPEMAGIRPKLQGPGQPFRDFLICDETPRGLPGLVNLIGIESPGLTACLSIARMVAELLT